MRIERRSRSVAATLAFVVAGMLGTLGPRPAHARTVATNGETVVVVSVVPSASPGLSDVRATLMSAAGIRIETTIASGIPSCA
jgi:hypothetical protein